MALLRFSSDRSLLRFSTLAHFALTAMVLMAAPPPACAQAQGTGTVDAPVPAQSPAAGQNPAPAQGAAAVPQQQPSAPQATPAAPTVQKPPSSAPTTTQQGISDQDLQGLTVLKTTVNEVNLTFAVTDKHGNFVRNLKQSDFALLDDRKPPQRVRQFTQQSNLPLRVGLVLDTSTSIRTRFGFEQDSATDFLLQVLRPQSDKAFVEGFNVKPTFTSAFTSDEDKLKGAIHRLNPAGGTALFDAVYLACRDQMLPLRSDGPEGILRKAIIVISDGDDNMSTVVKEDAIKMCQRADTLVYTISTNVSPDRDRGDDTLAAIAEATGGRAFTPQRVEDMANNFRNIEDELRSQYLLVYSPSDFKIDGAFRPIYLISLDRNYKVRARKGYFAPRQ